MPTNVSGGPIAMDFVLIFIVVLLVIGLIAWATGIRVINEYERGVVLRLGRLMRPKGPGLRVIIPFGIDKLIKVDLRTVTLEVPPQEAITVDNVTVTVLAVIYFQVVQPHLAVTAVQNYYNATSQIAQSTLRSVLGQCSLHDLLAERAKLNASLQRFIDEQTEPWGIKVTAVEIKDVEMPESMQRAMARQAEAEREKHAKIIAAEGEFGAAQKLAEAARVISSEPAALQLRYMQTLGEIGEEKNTVIVFPLPMDIIEPLIDLRGRRAQRPGPHSGDPGGAGRGDPPPPGVDAGGRPPTGAGLTGAPDGAGHGLSAADAGFTGLQGGTGFADLHGDRGLAGHPGTAEFGDIRWDATGFADLANGAVYPPGTADQPAPPSDAGMSDLARRLAQRAAPVKRAQPRNDDPGP